MQPNTQISKKNKKNISEENENDNFKEIISLKLTKIMNQEYEGNISKMAKKIEMNNGQLGGYIDGKRKPQLFTLSRIAKGLNVSISYLIGETKLKEANNIVIGEELGISDKTCENLREIKQKYNGEHEEILSEILTSPALFDLLVKLTDNEKIKEFPIEDIKQFYIPGKEGIKIKNTREFFDISLCSKVLNLYHTYMYNTYMFNYSTIEELEKEQKILDSKLRSIKYTKKKLQGKFKQ